MRILLVEDEPDLRTLLSNILFAAGYQVDSVGDKRGASALLEGVRYDLILTDDRLPDGRGIDIADDARAKGMAVVVITGYGARITHDEASRHVVLMKPVRPDELIEAVDRHIGATGDMMKKILLVEDEEDVRTPLELALRSAGYDVDCMRTATAARVAVASRFYDLVVTDWRLGDGSGIEIADLAATRGIRALIITGFASAMRDEERMRHEVLAKPFRPRELVSAVERQVGAASA